MGTLCFVALFRRWLYPQWKKTTLFCMCVKERWIQLAGYMLVSGIVLVACSGPGGNMTPTSPGTPAVKQIALSQVHWCGKPLQVFRDEGAVAASTPVSGTPKMVNDWGQVRADLGFTVFLPSTLPAGTCLMSASATVHDPIFGGNFTIGYLLPDHSSISFSEAPLRAQNTDFQCSPAPAQSGTKPVATTKAGATTQNSIQLCSGARNTTHIVFSARGVTSALEQLFQHLQPNVAWIPA